MRAPPEPTGPAPSPGPPRRPKAPSSLALARGVGLVSRALVALVALPALVAALGLGGCAVGTSPCEPRLTYAVSSPPPKPLSETPSARPTPGMVWVPGYWHWDAIRYVWVPGHWETPPPGRRWLPAETESEGGGYRYYAGVWGCDSGGGF